MASPARVSISRYDADEVSSRNREQRAGHEIFQREVFIRGGRAQGHSSSGGKAKIRSRSRHIGNPPMTKWDDCTRAKEAMFLHMDRANCGSTAPTPLRTGSVRFQTPCVIFCIRCHGGKGYKADHRIDDMFVGRATAGLTERQQQLKRYLLSPRRRAWADPHKRLLSQSAKSAKTRICEERISIMSRRAILSLAASAIIGIGLIGTISTDASAYRAGVYRGGAYRGGVYRGGVYRGGYYRGVRPGVAIGIGAAAVGAAAVGAAAAGAYYGPGYYGAPAPVGCPYGYYYYAPYNRCVPTPN